MRGEPLLMHDISEMYYNIDIAKETKLHLIIININNTL